MNEVETGSDASKKTSKRWRNFLKIYNMRETQHCIALLFIADTSTQSGREYAIALTDNCFVAPDFPRQMSVRATGSKYLKCFRYHNYFPWPSPVSPIDSYFHQCEFIFYFKSTYILIWCYLNHKLHHHSSLQHIDAVFDYCKSDEKRKTRTRRSRLFESVKKSERGPISDVARWSLTAAIVIENGPRFTIWPKQVGWYVLQSLVPLLALLLVPCKWWATRYIVVGGRVDPILHGDLCMRSTFEWKDFNAQAAGARKIIQPQSCTH